MEESSKECTQGLYNTGLVILLDQITIIIFPWCVCHFNNKAFDIVGISFFW